MDEQEEIAFIAQILQISFLSLKLLMKRRRKWWVRPLYQERSAKGFFETTFKFMQEHDEEMFFKATRLTKLQYNLLLSLVKGRLKKTSIRRPISAECRMVVTLMYLSQGVSPNYLAWSFRMGASTVRKIIIEVCDVFWEVLSPVYMAELNTGDWKTISEEFNDRWHMPHCVGSIDGKHVEIKRPPNSGSKYINYKGFFSIVLLAICDANYTFTAIDVGAYGSQSDGGIFKHSAFGKQIFLNQVKLPPPERLPNSQKEAPFFFVGDSAFPLRENLMRPYPGILLDTPLEVFNFRLSRARRIIENTFGILAARWRILNKGIEFNPEKADKVVLACAILHNFIKITDKIYNCSSYCPEGYSDTYDNNGQRIDGLWRQETQGLLSIRRCGSNNRAETAFEVRKTLTQYFLNEGRVPFQPR